jgi:hypothetical protein
MPLEHGELDAMIAGEPFTPGPTMQEILAKQAETAKKEPASSGPVALVVVLLFASVGMASAQCAWVVWRQFVTTTPPPGGIASWVAEKSFTSTAPCEALAAQLNEKTEWRRSETSNNVSTRSVCLPDTVDPRGPKGK